MSRGIKPDPNCPLISQSLLKSGVIHILTAKYLYNVTSIARKNKKIPFFPDNSSESVQIANELVIKYLRRFNLKYTIDSFRVESNITISNPSLPIKRLKLTYSQDPLKNFLKVVENSQKLRFHDTLVIQELLLRVPTLLDESTKSHFINILKKAGNFMNADDEAIFKLIQRNNKYNQNNKKNQKNHNNKEDINNKKISHSEPPKQPTNLSNSSNKINENNASNNGNRINSSSQRNRKSDMTDINRRPNSRVSSCSFNSSSSKNDSRSTQKNATETDSNSQSVVAQIACSSRNAYSCNLVDGGSGSDSISESNMMKQLAGNNKLSQKSSRNQTKLDNNSDLAGYANSSSSYFYEYETISEPGQEGILDGSTSSTQSEVGQLKKSSSDNSSHSSKADQSKHKKAPAPVPSTERKPKINYMTKVLPNEKMSLADQIESFDYNKKPIRKPSPQHQTQPEPSPRIYRLPVPDGYEEYKNKKKSSSKKTKSSSSSKTKSTSNPQAVMAQISILEKELKALQSDDYSDHEDSKTSQLHKKLVNAVKETSSSVYKRNHSISSSSSDDESTSSRNRQRVPSKTSFGQTLLDQKKNAKPVEHHHSRSQRVDDVSTTTKDSTSHSNIRKSNENDQSGSIVILKNVDNSRNRTISEQKQISQYNEQKSNYKNKTKEAPPLIDNQPETYRLTIPPDPFSNFQIDKKVSKETSNRQSQNQKQPSKLNQNQSQSQRLSQNQPHKFNQSQKQEQSQSQRPSQSQSQRINQGQKQEQSKSQRPQHYNAKDNQKNSKQSSNLLASSDGDELISDSPPPVMKQLWESKNKEMNKNNKTSNNATTTSKEKSKIDGLAKISNQNSSSSLYDAFVEEKSQHNQAKSTKQSTQKKDDHGQVKKDQIKESVKKQDDQKSKQISSQKVEPSKPSSSITWKQAPKESQSKATTSNTTTQNSTTNSTSKPSTTATKYTNHSKTASSLSASKYTNHDKTADSNATARTATKPSTTANSNSKFTSHAKTAPNDDDKMSTSSRSSQASTISQAGGRESSVSMRTMQPKSRQENRSVDQKKVGMSQRLFNLHSNIELSSGTGSQSESFRIPLQKTRIVRARMLSDLSEADFDDSSSSSITERRRLPPLKVEIPFHDGHARAFQNYYDFLSSSEAFELDKENGPIKKKIKEKLLKRSSSVNPAAMMPKRSSTSISKDAGGSSTSTSNAALKRASTANKVSNNSEQIKRDRPNSALKIDVGNASNVDRSSTENSKNATSNSSSSFVAHIKLVESEKLSRVDTFFVLYIDGSSQAKRTRTVKGKTSAKEFNEEFDFTITREKCNLVIQAKREDLINGDQYIAGAKLNLITLPLHKKHDKWVPLTTFGRVRLEMTLEKEGQAATKNTASNQPQKVESKSSTLSQSQKVETKNTTSNQSQKVESKSSTLSQPQKVESKSSTSNQSQSQKAGNAASSSASKEAATYSLADAKDIKQDNPDLKALLKITDEKKVADPLIKSIVTSMSQPKMAIDEPTVNVPLLSESSSSDASDGRADGGAQRKSKSKTRSKSRNRSRKSKK